MATFLRIERIKNSSPRVTTYTMKKITISEESLKNLASQGLGSKDIALKLGVKRSLIHKRCRELGIKLSPSRKLSEETRLLISAARKKWCADNPDKHPWRKNDKFKSVPCEKLKNWLKTKNIAFAEEFQPLLSEGRYFSIDIAFPDKMIGIEVNGNQHYNQDGTLKPYYQNRNDSIEALGWKLYQLHFSICYHIDKIESIIPTILESPVKTQFDYSMYKKKSPKIKISEIDPLWRNRPRFNARKIKIRPSKEELAKMIWEMSVCKIGEKYGISANAIERWIKEYEINEKPPRGYWNKRMAGQSHEEAMAPSPPKQALKKFTDAQILEILLLIQRGDLSLREIGRKYDVAHQVIANIRDGKTYKHISNRANILEENLRFKDPIKVVQTEEFASPVQRC